MLKRSLTEEELTVAKVGGPPWGWMCLEVVDLVSGEPIDRVLEVDAVGGWLVRYVLGRDGRILLVHGTPVLERIEGRFVIRRKSAHA
jgi:hypothetical protein